MAWKQIVTDYFTFTRKDRIAILVLVLLIFSVWLAPQFIAKKNKIPYPSPADSSWRAAVRKLEIRDTGNSYEEKAGYYQYDRSVPRYREQKKGELFFFDPNTLAAAGWEKLGIRAKTISTIQNYLVRGGRFKKPEDLRKIYGLFPDEYERIAPYVTIKSTEQPDFANDKGAVSTENQPDKKPTERYTVIDINSADTAAFIALPGIGSKLAARIVNFRDKLGGFYSVDQVAETFGLPDSTFQKIKKRLALENETIKKININTATLDELKAHPYIRYNLANPLVAYRNEHGPFIKIEDIRKVMAVNDEIYNKVLPYLSLQ